MAVKNFSSSKGALYLRKGVIRDSGIILFRFYSFLVILTE